MESRINDDFLKAYWSLPQAVRDIARANYQLWRRDPQHNSLEFKRLRNDKPFWSVRVGIHYRAVGIKTDADGVELIVWFWIGTHAEYDKFVSQMRKKIIRL